MCVCVCVYFMRTYFLRSLLILRYMYNILYNSSKSSRADWTVETGCSRLANCFCFTRRQVEPIISPIQRDWRAFLAGLLVSYKISNWFLNSTWSSRYAYPHKCIYLTRAHLWSAVGHIFAHTYMYMCNNNTVCVYVQARHSHWKVTAGQSKYA